MKTNKWRVSKSFAKICRALRRKEIKIEKFKQLLDNDMAMRLRRLEQATQLQPVLKALPSLDSDDDQSQLQPVGASDAEETTPQPPTAQLQALAPPPPTAQLSRAPISARQRFNRTNYQNYRPRLIQ